VLHGAGGFVTRSALLMVVLEAGSLTARSRAMRKPARICRARRYGSGGFTLLEVLVVLTILGLLMITLRQGIQLGLVARTIDARTDRAVSDLDSTEPLVRRLIAKASPMDPVSRETAFVGTAHTASFITILPDGFGATATREVEATLMVGASHRLELLWRPHYRRWVATPPAASAAALVDGVERLDVSFWQPGPGPRQGSWVSAWAASNPPALVRLHVVFPPGDGRIWPDIVVAPMRQFAGP
jgi:general secretion pathway protein J